MVSPAAMSIALITVMLWILWSDSFRKRPSQIVYVIRIMLFLVVAGVMVVNLVRYPHLFSGGARAIAIAAVIIGIGGAGYFGRRVVKRI